MSGRIFENISRQIDLFRQAKNYLQSNQYKIIRVQPLLFFSSPCTTVLSLWLSVVSLLCSVDPFILRFFRRLFLFNSNCIVIKIKLSCNYSCMNFIANLI